MTESLGALFRYLDGLQERPPLGDLMAAVAAAEVRWQEVADFIRFSEQGYMRNLVRAEVCHDVLVLCWKNGQRSPIHDHAGSSCCVRVLRGVLTETLFEFAPNGHVKAVASRDYSAGAILGSEDADMHQISNLQAGTADLVTLHVYAPPLRYMNTYSLFDRTRGLEPMLVEFSDAAGI